MRRSTPASGVPRRGAPPATFDVPASQRIAQTLRHAPDTLDEVTRARLERNLVEAWRARGAHAVPLPRLRPGLSRTVWMGSLAASAALGVALGLFMLRSQQSVQREPAPSVAHFDLVIGDGAVQSGVLVAGQVLESGKRGHIEVNIGQSRLDIAPDSRVRFDRLDRDELRVSLVQGRVDVEFNPEHKGGQRMSVETGAAQVLVVGTRFSVEAAPNRETRVSVSEGVVRVEPRRTRTPVMVRAGETLKVPVEPEAQPSKAQLAPAPLEKIEVAELSAPERSATRTSRTRSSARNESPEEKLESARLLILQGKHGEARERLRRLVKRRNALTPGERVEALVLMAESFTAQGEVPRAAAAYRQAVDAAPREAAGHNALFALARLLDRYTQDNENAAAAYREYLTKAPHGALARQARDALCRLSNCR